MRFYNSRSIPEGFQVKTVTVGQKADGWFVSVRIEDKTVPDFPVIPHSEITSITGCDMGLTKLVYLSNGSAIDNPRFATNKKTKRLMKIRQRRISRKQKGSKNRHKAQSRVTVLQAARNVRKKAIETYGLTIAKRLKKVPRDSSKPVHLSLFEIELHERLSDNTLPSKGSPACGLFPQRASVVALGC